MSEHGMNNGPVYHDLLQFAIELESASETTLKFIDDRSNPVSNIRSVSGMKAAFEPLAKNCTYEVLQLTEKIKEELIHRGVSRASFDILVSESGELSKTFDKYGLIAPERALSCVMRMEQALDEIEFSDAKLPKENKKQVLRAFEKLKLRCAAYEIHKTKTLISNLIPQIRKKARIQLSSPRKQDFEELHDIRQSIELVESIARPSIEGTGIRLSVRNSDRPIFTRVDKETLVYCLKLLLDNALKYTNDLPEQTGYSEPWIKVRVFDRGSHIDIEIDSWGTPITHEEIDKRLIFKRGYRGHFAIAEHIAGTGNGLAEVDEFMTSIGGEINVRTDPVSKASDHIKPKRSVFKMSIPLS